MLKRSYIVEHCQVSHFTTRFYGRVCDECNLVKVHYGTLYMYLLLIPVRAFPSEGCTTWVRRYCNLARVMMRIVLPVPPGTYMYAQLI
jgi:hypothetical protein